MISVAIGICTYHRNEELLKLVAGINNLEIDADKYFLKKVIIVDNSYNNEVKKIENKLTSIFNMKVYHELEQGIPFARNRCIEEANGCDYIAFIDDDEVPKPDWLTQLIDASKKFNCNIVQGPVIPKFPDNDVSEWIKKTQMRDRYKSGYCIPYMATNNLLIKLKLFNEYGLRFNEDMRNTGGTDSYLGRQFIDKGEKIIWCDDAIVYEVIPKDRARVRWILQRKFRGVNNHVLQLRKRNDYLKIYTYELFKAVYYILIGLILMPFYFLIPNRRYDGLVFLIMGLGGGLGILGYNYNEYKNKD